MPKPTKTRKIRPSIGGFRTPGHGGLLSTEKTLQLLIEKFDALENDQIAMIDALQQLGLDRCDTSRKWLPKTQLICAGDRCQSVAEFSPDHFWNEDDDETQGFANMVGVFIQIQAKGHYSLKAKFPHNGKILQEPYLKAYKQALRIRQPN